MRNRLAQPPGSTPRLPVEPSDDEGYARPGARSRAGAGAAAAARCLLTVSGFCSTLALVAAGAALVVMLGYVAGSVVGRYTGWWELLGADEIGGYMMAALFFLGLGHSFRNGAFIRVTILQRKLPPRLRSASENLLYLVALAYAVILDWYFWQLILQSREFGTTSIGVLAWPIWLPQLSLGVGTAIFAAQIFALLLGRLAGVVHGWLGEHGAA